MISLEHGISPIDQFLNREIYDRFNSKKFYNGWAPEVQRANFNVFTLIEKHVGFPLKGSSCLDVGCGTGELAGFLRDRGVSRYLGIDIVSSSIELARQRNPEMTFRQGDFLIDPKSEAFDFVFCSGAMTLDFPSGNYDYMRRMISRMVELSKKGVAFNYLSKTLHGGKLICFIYEREKVRELCDSLGLRNRVEVSTWLGVDFQDTVFIRK
jgi:SAM-dependent methyltransferase